MCFNKLRVLRKVLFVQLVVSGLVLLTPLFVHGKSIAELNFYPAPQGVSQNDDFSVRVRIPGQKWQEVSTYSIKVDHVLGTVHSPEDASMGYFDFAEEVEVSVTFNKGEVNSARVRPLSKRIIPMIDGKTIFFKLDKPANLSVEVNGDIFHNLHLFANPIETFKPTPGKKGLLFYGPGVHIIPGGKLKVPSGKTVYIAGGAVIKGQILIQNAENVKVLGRGMVDDSVKMGIRVANSKNVEVEGLFSTQCAIGGSENVTIRNVKVISYFGWGDGMNVFSSNNVLMDGVFNRNSDDCTTVYGTRLGFTGGCKNITMKNSTLWADVAHPILIGTHGNTKNPEILEGLTYLNIDILDHKEGQLDYQGCFAINAGDNNLIRNVRFEDIRVEDFREGQLVNIRVFFNPKYCTAAGRGVENVLFKNISYNGSNAGTSVIAGYNEQRMVKNVVFENLRINGNLIYDAMPDKPKWYRTSDMAKIFVGEHVDQVTFIKTAEK